jgi:hypothetical protein
LGGGVPVPLLRKPALVFPCGMLELGGRDQVETTSRAPSLDDGGPMWSFKDEDDDDNNAGGKMEEESLFVSW